MIFVKKKMSRRALWGERVAGVGTERCVQVWLWLKVYWRAFEWLASLRGERVGGEGGGRGVTLHSFTTNKVASIRGRGYFLP